MSTATKTLTDDELRLYACPEWCLLAPEVHAVRHTDGFTIANHRGTVQGRGWSITRTGATTHTGRVVGEQLVETQIDPTLTPADAAALGLALLNAALRMEGRA